MLSTVISVADSVNPYIAPQLELSIGGRPTANEAAHTIGKQT